MDFIRDLIWPPAPNQQSPALGMATVPIPDPLPTHGNSTHPLPTHGTLSIPITHPSVYVESSYNLLTQSL
jgi:hypothetical protein